MSLIFYGRSRVLYVRFAPYYTVMGGYVRVVWVTKGGAVDCPFHPISLVCPCLYHVSDMSDSLDSPHLVELSTT
jgi:hypothetical protein